jgi:hypothetical protein
VARAARSSAVKHTRLAAGLVAFALVGAVACPLLAYSTSLAAFGLAHALVELRVLDRRVRPRIDRATSLAVVTALATVLAVRVAANLGACTRDTAHTVELAAGIAATSVVVPWVIARRRATAVGAVLVAGALLVGVLVAPLVTLLVLAVLHNLAPWPLLLDAVAPHRRGELRAAGIVVFVAIPALIVSGVPFAALASLGLTSPEATVLPTGPLFDHFGAFWGPPPLDYPTLALHVFSACAYLQCAHYISVLLLLPTTASDVPPRTVAAIVVVSAAIGAAYAVDFAGARAWYGTIAGVHAWAEFPALLVVWACWQRTRHPPPVMRHSPTPNDAAFATSDVTSAAPGRTPSVTRKTSASTTTTADSITA